MPGPRRFWLALLAVLAAAPPAVAAPLRVVAFGDSLTAGFGSTHQAGYRLSFLERMGAAGFEVDMLGSNRHGPEGMDPDHEGYPGRGVAKLDEVSFREIRRDHPDVVLVMIGTNDAREFQPDAFRIRYSVLLDRMLSESRVRLVAATVPPTRYGKGKRTRVERAINKIIREEVEKRRAAGRPLALIDVFELIDDRRDYIDQVHLNDEGYAKVGTAFADALIALLKQHPLPSAVAPAEAADLDAQGWPGEASAGTAATPP